MKILKNNYRAFESEILPAPVEDLELNPELKSVEIETPEQKPKITESSRYTYFRGKLCRYSQIKTSKFTINAQDFWDYPLSYDKRGLLHHFQISVNDEDMKVIVKLFDFQNNEFELNYKTMKELSMIGRGLTSGEANANAPSESSLDKSGQVHPTMPYLARYKNGLTGTETVYENYVGTFDDRWITLAYYPIEPLEFNRLEIDIQNTRTDGAPRYVHEVELALIFPLDSVPDTTVPVIGSATPSDEGKEVIGQDPLVQKISTTVTGDDVLTITPQKENPKVIVAEDDGTMIVS